MIPEGVPCIHYGEMYTHYNVWADKAKSYISPELASKLRKANFGDVVLVSAGETIEDIGRGTAWLGGEDVVIHDACFFYKSSLNPKYVAYFSRTEIFRNQIKKSISSGKISAINAKGFEKVIIPIPSLEEQTRIVTILDDFDTLTCSITEGLPREIALRQQQYEYYRDLLFSFPKPDEAALLPVLPHWHTGCAMTQQTHPIAETNHYIVLDKYTRAWEGGDSYQSESDLERELIQDLRNQGYEFVSLPTQQAMLVNVRTQLQALNGVVFNDGEWRRFCERYLDSPSDSSLDKTRKIHIDYICDFTFDNGQLENIYLIDKKSL
ncbi:hypothetical protein PSTG_18038, partial [Puccinia striiformis f. sp. tritici PST-78]